MIKRGIVVRKSAKDPETFIPIQRYILSDELREAIGVNLVKLFAKVAEGKGSGGITIGDAFIAAAMAALLATSGERLGEDEIALCTDVVLKLLPYEKLRAARLARKTLRRLSWDMSLVRKLKETCYPLI